MLFTTSPMNHELVAWEQTVRYLPVEVSLPRGWGSVRFLHAGERESRDPDRAVGTTFWDRCSV